MIFEPMGPPDPEQECAEGYSNTDDQTSSFKRRTLTKTSASHIEPTKITFDLNQSSLMPAFWSADSDKNRQSIEEELQSTTTAKVSSNHSPKLFPAVLKTNTESLKNIK